MILGNSETIKRSREAKAGDKSNFVNWDAIDAMPEEFEPVITKVTYDPNKLDGFFDDVGEGAYMPTPKVMYAMAEACGIYPTDKSFSEPLYQRVDKCRLWVDFKSDPMFIEMHVGHKAIKQSKVLTEDGSWRPSSVCTIEYNAWQYCVKLWSAEEMYTNGYTKAGKYDNKYQNRFQRQKHLDDSLKFAQRMTETKAHCKTIRELAGLPTGFKKEDLTSGFLIFSKIQRSKSSVKAESAARLHALSHGLGDGGNAASIGLFGPHAQIQAPTVEQEPEQQNVQDAESERLPDDDDSPFGNDPPPKKSPQEEYAAVLSHYHPKMVPNDKQERAGKILGWVRSETDRTNSKDWSAAIGFLKEIEAALPDDMRLTHTLY